jgi:hypothetical protein
MSSQVLTYMGDFLTDYMELWAIPVGVCAVGLVLTVVINALRNR